MIERFWETKSLEEFDEEEWEALCDGCAQCCRMRFRDTESDRVATSTVVCECLDLSTRRCEHYRRRSELVKDCVPFTPARAREFSWLPDSCAYRRLAEGLELEDWHPLISGTTDTVTRAGVSVDGQVVSAKDVHPDDIELHILKWV